MVSDVLKFAWELLLPEKDPMDDVLFADERRAQLTASACEWRWRESN
ncbi:MAG: hypothetical protein HY269_05310 [Deltaproteobacteria bacterium]|nr:hypothetical protein [Deltaproteobacteria bacterium]